jgi:hypothetical protein
MADNYLQFSESLPNLTAEEEAWLIEQLQPIAVFGDREYQEGDAAIAAQDGDPSFTGPRFLRDDPDFDSSDVREFEFAIFNNHQDGPSPTRELWLFAEGYGNPDQVAWLVQKFLKRFRPDQCWSLTYAVSCSRARIGEFGSGAIFVTASEIEWHDAGDFVVQKRAVFKQNGKPHSSGECIESHADH